MDDYGSGSQFETQIQKIDRRRVENLGLGPEKRSMSQKRNSKPMKQLLFAGLFVLFYSPLLSGQRDLPKPELSLRQRTEVLFQNGVRNAQRKNDIYGQVQALRKIQKEMTELRLQQPKQALKDEKLMDHRMAQLKKMIEKELPIESL